jgi:hypothetical protein
MVVCLARTQKDLETLCSPHRSAVFPIIDLNAVVSACRHGQKLEEQPQLISATTCLLAVDLDGQFQPARSEFVLTSLSVQLWRANGFNKPAGCQFRCIVHDQQPRTEIFGSEKATES